MDSHARYQRRLVKRHLGVARGRCTHILERIENARALLADAAQSPLDPHGVFARRYDTLDALHQAKHEIVAAIQSWECTHWPHAKHYKELERLDTLIAEHDAVPPGT